MKINAEKGLPNGSTSGLGFKVDKYRHFYADPKETAIVREAFERYSQGETATDIIDLVDTYGYDCFVKTLDKAEEKHQRIAPLLRGDFTLNTNLEQIKLLSIEAFRRRSESFWGKCRNKK